MQFKVRIFIDEEFISSQELSKVAIRNENVDRIVNDIFEKTYMESTDVKNDNKK